MAKKNPAVRRTSFRRRNLATQHLLVLIAWFVDSRKETRSAASKVVREYHKKRKEVVFDIPYFYEHVPKTGGVSFAADLKRHFSLVSCRGRGAITLPQIIKNGTVIQDWTSALQYKVCDFVNTEGHFQNTLLKFPTKPKILLMARDPVAHVISIYTHCQDPSVGSLQKWKHNKSSIDEWLSLLTLNKDTSHICHMDPRDMQTTRLCAHDWSICKRLVLYDAFFVARLEQYDTSLCALFLFMFNGVSMPIYCNGFRPSGITFTQHKTHSAHSSSIQVSESTRALIIALTPLDHAYSRLAEARFLIDLESYKRNNCIIIINSTLLLPFACGGNQ